MLEYSLKMDRFQRKIVPTLGSTLKQFPKKKTKTKHQLHHSCKIILSIGYHLCNTSKKQKQIFWKENTHLFVVGEHLEEVYSSLYLTVT